MTKYSASANAFYFDTATDEQKESWPTDLVDISDERMEELSAACMAGDKFLIVPGEDGYPEIVLRERLPIRLEPQPHSTEVTNEPKT
jgi:hypothetical protein